MRFLWVVVPPTRYSAPASSARMTLLLAFTLAGYNLEAIRSFLTKKRAERATAPPKRTRRKRRKGTWVDVIGSNRPESSRGRAPPAG